MSHLPNPAVLEQLDLYQDWALRLWLPNAVRNPASLESQAIHELAKLLEQNDHDSWMTEFFASFSRRQMKAAEALSAAIKANKNGSYEAAVKQSELAAAEFAKSGNLAGQLRSQVESIYASQRSLEGFNCLNQIASLKIPDRYRWLRIQTSLEKYTCSNLGGEFRTIQQGLEANRKEAEESHLYLLALRSIALTASTKRQQQQGCREVWATVLQGLDLYWKSGPYPPDRLYEFYSNLEQCATQAGLWWTAEAFQRRCISLLESPDQDHDPNLALEGSAHAELAAILTAEDDDNRAAPEQNKADSLWKKIGNERTANTYRLFMRVHLAEIQLRRGDGNRALSTLNSSRELLDSTQYRLLDLNFYRALGDAYWSLKRASEAGAAYSNGIAIAESSLPSIRYDSKDRLQWLTKADQVYRGMTRVWIAQGETGKAWRLWEWYRTRSLMAIPLEQTHQPNGISWEAVDQRIARLQGPSQPHLVYASFDDGLQVWEVKGSTVIGRWIGIRQKELEGLVNRFAEECSDRYSSLNKLQTHAHELYALLLSPLDSDLISKNPLVVELDWPLSRLVLAAMIDPNGKYFAENHSIVYSPGILMEDSLRRSQPIESIDRVLLIDASQSNGQDAVPGHLEERQAAFQAYRHVQFMDGSRATPITVKRELLKSTVLDFIGHGEQQGSYTALRLSKKEMLRPEDFDPQTLSHIKLGILAACSTGAVGEDRLLDTGNLVHSFLSARVPNVIASQWNVDSSATAQLMKSFHFHLGSGQSAAEAMHAAQKETIGIYSHPYFWAGFNLFGRAD